MAKGTYVGVGGVARKVKNLYMGVGGVARKVTKVYVGVSGVPRLAYTSSIPRGELVFTASTTWKVPEGVKVIDVFCVGGGGSSGSAWYDTGANSRNANSSGGGSGYTTTAKTLNVTSGQQISVVIGAGAPSAPRPTSSGSSYASTNGLDGGSSSFIGVTANGGNGGHARTDNAPLPSIAGLSDGGSGGAAGGLQYSNGTYYGVSGSGGIDGNNGDIIINYGAVTVEGGKGHKRTTKAFAESDGTLYASGGNTYTHTAPPAVPANTGNGGHGSNWFMYTSGATESIAGSSGVVIVRWAEQ